jgi:transposase
MVKRGPRGRPQLDHFAGLDVSVKETSVGIVDDTGKIVREVRVPSEPKALLKVLTEPGLSVQADRIGSGAAITMAAQRALAEAGLPMICHRW